MKQILWFRRDLRIIDNKILEKACNEVMPIFIFDKNILEKLDVEDKRVTFIYDAVLSLKKSLKRVFASSSLMVTPAINISVNNPLLGSCSIMRGRA